MMMTMTLMVFGGDDDDDDEMLMMVMASECRDALYCYCYYSECLSWQ